MSDKDIEKAAVKSTNKKNWEKGEFYFRALIERKPDYADAYTELATCLFNLDRGDEAIEYIETAIQLAPDDPTVLVTCGVLLATTGSLIGPIEHYHKGIEYIEKAKSLGYKDKELDAVLEILKQKI